MKEFWLRLWQEHPGALVGTTLGVLWALLAVGVGFFAALFVLIAGFVGWFVGMRHDSDAGDWGELIEHIFQRERD